MPAHLRLLLLIGGLVTLAVPDTADAGRRRAIFPPHEALGHQLFASPQVNPIVLSNDGSLLYVAATTTHPLPR